jgi:glycine cleavage system H lipoate-binding protein/ABC-type phosphate transport system substrate-binding protein
MKTKIILLISFILLNYSNINSKDSMNEISPAPGDSIKLLSTPDLYKLSVKWVYEFTRMNPEIKVRVISVPDAQITENLLKNGNIGLVSNKYLSGFNNDLLWKVVVGRDIIVPVINSKNPYLAEICQKGISPEVLSVFINNTNSQTWGTLLKNSQNSAANYYRVNDESIQTGLAAFIKTDHVKNCGIEAGSGEDLISAIQKDPYAIGFCKMVNVMNFSNQSIAENIRLLPLDRDGNGIIDSNEKIYDDLNVFSRGVWIGKYPKTLFSNIYSVASDQPKNETEAAFLKWIVTDGQKFLDGNGYSDLLITERQSAVDKLNNAVIYAGTASDNKSLPKILLFIITTVILAGLIADAVARYRRRKKAVVTASFNIIQPVFNENSLIVPKGLYFDKTHTWAFMEQNGEVKVGIDDFLQHLTGEITRIKMKNQGDKVKKGELIMSVIQYGKQLNLYSPVSGVILKQNETLNTNSSLVNSSPYNDGWVYMIEPENWARENQLLFTADKYRQFIKNEFTRLKDFLAAALYTDTEKYGRLVLQDGGELREGVLSNLGPEIWEDFQTKYIDPSRQLWFYEMF